MQCEQCVLGTSGTLLKSPCVRAPGRETSCWKQRTQQCIWNYRMEKHCSTRSCARQEAGVGQHGISAANFRHTNAFLFCCHLSRATIIIMCRGIPSVSKTAKLVCGLRNVKSGRIQALSNKLVEIPTPAVLVGQILNFNGALGQL